MCWIVRELLFVRATFSHLRIPFTCVIVIASVGARLCVLADLALKRRLRKLCEFKSPCITWRLASHNASLLVHACVRALAARDGGMTVALHRGRAQRKERGESVGSGVCRAPQADKMRNPRLLGQRFSKWSGVA